MCKKPKCKKLFGIHKWEYIYCVGESTFMGEKVKTLDKKFRRCVHCKGVQESNWCSVGEYWSWLTLAQEDVFNSKVKEGQTEINPKEYL